MSEMEKPWQGKECLLPKKTKSTLSLDTQRGRMAIYHNKADAKLFDFKDYVSSLHKSNPEFEYPIIEYDENKNNTWKKIAGNILTNFAPKIKLYDYEKYLPTTQRDETNNSFYKSSDDNTPIRSPLKRDTEISSPSSPGRRGFQDRIKEEHEIELETIRKNNVINFIYNPVLNVKTLQMNKKIDEALKDSNRFYQESDQQQKRIDLLKTMKNPMKQPAEVVFNERLVSGDGDDNFLIISQHSRNDHKFGLNANKEIIVFENTEPNEHKTLSPSPRKRYHRKSLNDLDAKSFSIADSVELSELDIAHEQEVGHSEFSSMAKFSSMYLNQLNEELASKRKDDRRDSKPLRKKSSSSRRPTISTPKNRPVSNLRVTKENFVIGSRNELESGQQFHVKQKLNKGRKVLARRKSDVSKWSGGECFKLKKHMDILLPADLKSEKNVENFERLDTARSGIEDGLPQRTTIMKNTSRRDRLLKKPLVRKLDSVNDAANRNNRRMNSNILPGINNGLTGPHFATFQGERKGQHFKRNEFGLKSNPKELLNTNNLIKLGKYTAKSITVVPPINIKTLENPELKQTIKDLYNSNPQQERVEFFDLEQNESTRKKETKELNNRLQTGDLKTALDLVLNKNPRANGIFNLKQSSEKKEKDSGLPIMKVASSNLQPIPEKSTKKNMRSSSVRQLIPKSRAENPKISPYELPISFSRTLNNKHEKAPKSYFIVKLKTDREMTEPDRKLEINLASSRRSTSVVKLRRELTN